MKRKIKFGIILFFVLLAAAAVFFAIIQPKMQEKEIRTLLDNANYCSVDSDCTILNTNLGCPFGCYNFGNKKADMSEINALWDAYQKRNSGSVCVYSCLIAPGPEEIKCVNNKCVDVRVNP